MFIKLKHFIKFFLYYLSGLFLFYQKSIPKRSLLLIRSDRIGDYLLFRNFLQVLKESQKYKGYQITMIGNCIWKEIAEKYDNNFVDHIIWVDTFKFNKNFFYRRKVIKEIVCQNYNIVVSPVHSRDYYATDWIVGKVHAAEKIGDSGDAMNNPLWQKRIADLYYSSLINTGDGVIFEFNRNKKFFEILLGRRINICKPYFDRINKTKRPDISKPYVVLFVGASMNYKKWPAVHFAMLGEMIHNKFSLPIVLCGGVIDKPSVKKHTKILQDGIIDLVGNTSLLELLEVIQDASIVVSNDTMAPHIASALNIPCIVIYNGMHLGRFLPYPDEMQPHLYVIYHPEIRKDIEAYKVYSNSFGNKTELSIADISAEEVFDLFCKVQKY